jgi:hypothetical protein
MERKLDTGKLQQLAQPGEQSQERGEGNHLCERLITAGEF